MDKKKLTPAELLAARKWMDFLRSLPLGESLWRIESYRDFVSLRSSASILTKGGYENKFSINQDKEDSSVYRITTSPSK